MSMVHGTYMLPRDGSNTGVSAALQRVVFLTRRQPSTPRCRRRRDPRFAHSGLLRPRRVQLRSFSTAGSLGDVRSRTSIGRSTHAWEAKPAEACCVDFEDMLVRAAEHLEKAQVSFDPTLVDGRPDRSAVRSEQIALESNAGTRSFTTRVNTKSYRRSRNACRRQIGPRSLRTRPSSVRSA